MDGELVPVPPVGPPHMGESPVLLWIATGFVAAWLLLTVLVMVVLLLR